MYVKPNISKKNIFLVLRIPKRKYLVLSHIFWSDCDKYGEEVNSIRISLVAQDKFPFFIYRYFDVKIYFGRDFDLLYNKSVSL